MTNEEKEVQENNEQTILGEIFFRLDSDQIVHHRRVFGFFDLLQAS